MLSREDEEVGALMVGANIMKTVGCPVMSHLPVAEAGFWLLNDAPNDSTPESMTSDLHYLR